jgi:NAD+ kinase
MLIRRIGILFHPMVEATSSKARELTAFLGSRGVDVWSCSAWETDKALGCLDSTDLILTIGGDGTILRAAQVAVQGMVPITGINMGNLGFLTELKANEAVEQLPNLLAGQGWMDERTMLEVELTPAEPGGDPRLFQALNDVVLARGAVAKLIQINTRIDEKTLTTYRADGVILATATGSTGYSLAAGGPILNPQSTDLLLVPIVSHLSLDYSLVLSSTSVIKLKLITTNQATFSVDGHINIPVSDGALVSVKTSAKKTRFLRLHERDFFYQALEEKLKGKK